MHGVFICDAPGVGPELRDSDDQKGRQATRKVLEESYALEYGTARCLYSRHVRSLESG